MAAAPSNMATVPNTGPIDSIRKLPDAQLLSCRGGAFPLPDEWRTQFAVLKAGAAHYLVVSTEAYGSAQMFEVRRRMSAVGHNPIQIIQATRDVVGLCYSERGAETNEAQPRTRIEEMAASIIEDAVVRGASDIHIESRVSRANIFLRINGSRVFYRDLTAESAHSLGVVLYSVHADAASKETTWDPTNVSDGALQWTTKTGASYQLRFSSAPIYPNGGFHIVIRLLPMEAKGRDLSSLGYTQDQLAMLDIMTSGSNGLVLLCGPTNSGKSTSLQALMGRIYQKRGDTIKMLTVEDPVEYVIPGACQISVARKRRTHVDAHTNSAFTTFLRGTLRQDPDVVMVGEIRDHDSASIVKDLVLAGRKMLATLHTYSALWAYVRLREIGVPWEILTMPGFVAGIVYQRLVPVLCPKCSIPLREGVDRMPKDVLYRVQQVADLSSDDIRLRGDGCPSCTHTGLSGQTVCAEFVLPDRVLLRYLAEGNYLEAEKYWRKSSVGAVNGGVAAISHGIQKMRQGLVSPVDIEDQIGLLTSDLVFSDSMITSHDLNALSGMSR